MSERNTNDTNPTRQEHRGRRRTIRVHRTSTSFDSVPRTVNGRLVPVSVQLERKAITGIFNWWVRFSGRLTRSLGWYPRVEPYVGYGTSYYARLICRTVMAPRNGVAGAMMRGIRGMLAVPAPEVRVNIAIDDMPVTTVQVGVPEIYDPVEPSRRQGPDVAVSDSSGYLDLVAELGMEPGVHRVSYTLDKRPAALSDLFVVAPGTKVGVISDVDDTIMITQAPSLLKAAYNLLLLNPRKRVSVPGMSALFAKIADIFPDAPFFYLSTSPWNVEGSIRHFITDHGFPAGPLLLRDLDPRPKTFVPSGVEHKLEFFDQLMADFPDMKFILVGDDGQRDPSTYATVAKRYPGRILAVAIRQLTPKEASPLGGVAGLAPTEPMPVTDVPVFTGATGANLMKTMLPYLRQVAL